MRIASYNIRKAIGLDWRRDGDRIADVLFEMNADVVVVQEADKRVGARAGVLPLSRLERELDYELANLSVRPQSHGWHGNAILFRNTLRVEETQRIDIPTIEPRGVVSASFRDPQFEILGVHLGLTPGMRRRQMQALATHIEGRSHPVIIAGDFNEWKKDAGVFGPSAEMVLPGLSFHASRPTAALDRFVLAGTTRYVSSHVHKSELARRASDHLPIVLDIDFGDRTV